MRFCNFHIAQLTARLYRLEKSCENTIVSKPSASCVKCELLQQQLQKASVQQQAFETSTKQFLQQQSQAFDHLQRRFASMEAQQVAMAKNVSLQQGQVSAPLQALLSRVVNTEKAIQALGTKMQEDTVMKTTSMRDIPTGTSSRRSSPVYMIDECQPQHGITQRVHDGTSVNTHGTSRHGNFVPQYRDDHHIEVPYANTHGQNVQNNTHGSISTHGNHGTHGIGAQGDITHSSAHGNRREERPRQPQPMRPPSSSKGHTPLRGDDEEDFSSEDDNNFGATRQPKTDPYATRELCLTLIGTPHWDGKSLNWRSFLKEWKVFWGFQKPLVGPKAKKWIFIQSLPEKWRNHMKAYITDHDWKFRQIVLFLDKQCQIMVPDWKKLQTWRACMPQGATYMDFTHWWLTWCRLGNECDLREKDWIHQFNSCMNFKSFFSKYLRDMVELEITDEGPEWSLERRKKFVENKLMVAFKAHETLQEVQHRRSESRTLRTPPECFHCGQSGHFSVACPKKKSLDF